MTIWTRRHVMQGGLALAGLGLTAGCGMMPLRWQQPAKVPRIGYLALRSSGRGFEMFCDGLRDLGYVEGQTISIETRWAESTEQLPSLAAELVALPVDVILAGGTTPVKAAMGATRTIPIVFPVISNPVRLGFVASLARPDGNVTGLSDLAGQAIGKRLQLLLELVPGASRIMRLADTAIDEAIGNVGLREAREAAQSLGVTLVTPDFRTPADLAAAFGTAVVEHTEAVLVNDSPLTIGETVRIVALASAARLPLMSQNPPFVAAGGLVSYGVNTDVMYRRAATYVGKILKGATPADLPVEQVTTFDLAINVKTAQTLGLTIPQSVLQQATEVIQ